MYIATTSINNDITTVLLQQHIQPCSLVQKVLKNSIKKKMANKTSFPSPPSLSSYFPSPQSNPGFNSACYARYVSHSNKKQARY